jgi:hypothetical protein
MLIYWRLLWVNPAFFPVRRPTAAPRYVFSKCYRCDPRAAALREDAKFMAEVEELKARRS